MTLLFVSKRIKREKEKKRQYFITTCPAGKKKITVCYKVHRGEQKFRTTLAVPVTVTKSTLKKKQDAGIEEEGKVHQFYIYVLTEGLSDEVKFQQNLQRS